MIKKEKNWMHCRCVQAFRERRRVLLLQGAVDAGGDRNVQPVQSLSDKVPGEEILQEAADFSAKFLHQKRADNELLDKWIITKDLPGEVFYYSFSFCYYFIPHTVIYSINIVCVSV